MLGSTFKNLLALAFYEQCSAPFTRALDEFLQDYGIERFKTIVHDTSHYDWYYGNIAHCIVMAVFDPDLMFHTFDMGTTDMRVTHEQAMDGLYCLWKLVQVMDLNVLGQRDYYDMTPRDVLMRVIASDVKNEGARHLGSVIPGFYMVLKHGKEGVVTLQQKGIMRWAERKRAIKKKAAGVIEKWWLEIVLSPYHKVGSRYLGEMALTWNKM